MLLKKQVGKFWRVSIYVCVVLKKDERIISLEESNLSVFAPSEVEVYPLKGN